MKHNLMKHNLTKHSKSHTDPISTTDSLTADVTEAELAVLKTLWNRGCATIREITDDLYPGGGTAHYATVQKLLDRLRGKSCISREPQGRANVFRATIQRPELISHRLQATANSLCEGSLTPLLTQLVDSAPLSADDLTALRELVERLAPSPVSESDD